jgi:hypothetical protein
MSKSRRTHGHISLSHLRLPQPGGPGSRIYFLSGTGWPRRRDDVEDAHSELWLVLLALSYEEQQNALKWATAVCSTILFQITMHNHLIQYQLISAVNTVSLNNSEPTLVWLLTFT